MVAVIALLIGILVPSLGQARQSAQTTQCSSNLRQLALASLSYAADQKGYLCSGPWAPEANRGFGALDKAGWVADQVRGEYGLPGQALCPSHVARTCQSIHPTRSRLNQEQIDSLIDRGFNTNYTQSWYMGHTGVPNHYDTGFSQTKDPRRTRGPLNLSSIGTTAASRVPLFGDARSDLRDRDSLVTIKGQVERAVKNLTDGPIFLNGRWDRQNYTDFGPAHGKGGMVYGDKGHDHLYANMVFADGHTERFQDVNGPLGTRDGEFGHKIIDEKVVYDDIEGKVFGGWLVQAGLKE